MTPPRHTHTHSHTHLPCSTDERFNNWIVPAGQQLSTWLKVGILTAVLHTGRRSLEVISTCEEEGGEGAREGRAHFSFMNAQSIRWDSLTFSPPPPLSEHIHRPTGVRGLHSKAGRASYQSRVVSLMQGDVWKPQKKGKTIIEIKAVKVLKEFSFKAALDYPSSNPPSTVSPVKCKTPQD